MTEPHANPEGLDLYALGALEGEEKQRLNAHLRDCAGCRQQLAAARQRTALLGLSSPPVTPTPSVKSALLQKVRAEERTMAKEETAKNAAPNQATPAEPKKIRWGLRFSLGFATATVILAIATFQLWKLNSEREHEIEQLHAQLDGMHTQMSQDQAAMKAMGEVTGAPDSAQITLLQQPGGPPGQARVTYNARMGMGIYSGQIAPAPAGKSYQLWLVPASGAPVSAGLVDAYQKNGAMVMHLTPGLVASAFAVTMEPQGGMPQPTGPKILVGAAT